MNILSTILSSASGSVRGVSAGSAPISTTSIPPSIMNLPSGTIIKGNVTGNTEQGHIIVNTSKGDLVLKTDIFMKRGVEVSIKLEKAVDELMAKLITIDGKSVSKYVDSIKPQHPQGDVVMKSNLYQNAQTSTAKQAGQAGFNANTELKAVILSSNNVPANILQKLDPKIAKMITEATNGSKLNVKITSIQLPTTGQASATSTQQPASQTTGTPVANTTSATTQPQAPSGNAQLSNSAIVDPIIGKAYGKENLQQNAPAQNKAASTSSLLPTEKLPTTQTNATTNQSTAVTTSAQNAAAKTAASQNTQASAPQAQAPATNTSAAAQPAQTQAKPVTATLNAAANTATTDTTAKPLDTAAQNQNSTIKATIINSTPPSAMTLQSPLGSIRLFSPSLLPKGATVSMEILSIDNSNIAASVKNPTAGMPAQLQQFNGMESILSLSHTMAGQPSSIHLIPHAGKELGAEILFMLSALKGGDVKKWLGDKNVQVLEKSGLLRKISSEFQLLQNSKLEASEAGQWNSVQLPISHDDKVTPIYLFYRGAHQQQEGEQTPTNDDDEGKSTPSDHFVVDVNLTHIGTIQLDGTVKRMDKNDMSFNLIIRTPSPLTSDIEQGIRDIYRQAQDISGFGGKISFNSGGSSILDMQKIMQLSKTGHTAATQSEESEINSIIV